jgi:hypothetical protein
LKCFARTLVDDIRQQTLDESPGVNTSLSETVRDAGYRAGHNDRNRSVIVLIEVKAGLRDGKA